jgi:hypothetical protein
VDSSNNKNFQYIISGFSGKGYFKTVANKLYTAPVKEDGQSLDLKQAFPVDYFFLTTDEFADAMAVLSILDEREGIDNEIQ